MRPGTCARPHRAAEVVRFEGTERDIDQYYQAAEGFPRIQNQLITMYSELCWPIVIALSEMAQHHRNLGDPWNEMLILKHEPEHAKRTLGVRGRSGTLLPLLDGG